MNSGYGSDHLRLYTEESLSSPLEPAMPSGTLPKLLQAFERATGCSLRYSPSTDDEIEGSQCDGIEVGSSDGALKGRLVFGETTRDGASPDAAARGLASAIGGLLGELLESQNALWRREAELAAAVPVTPHSDEAGHLAIRLESVLRGATEAIDCQAAALYLLDDTTSTLKTRSTWGLPKDRLTAPPRELRGALADLEALLGHAVVLEDDLLKNHWRPPEDFAAAVCVPISTPTTILGTLWIFSDKERPFDDNDTCIAEMAAGRIASDLERETLLGEGLRAAKWGRQLDDAQRLQKNQLPSAPPLVDGWDVAGWSGTAEELGGDFHDWFLAPDGRLVTAAADIMERGVEAAMAASGLQSALRAHGQYTSSAVDLVKHCNMTMWSGSAGEQYGEIACAVLDPLTGETRIAGAGELSIIHGAADFATSLTFSAPVLGRGPESQFHESELFVRIGELLVFFSDGIRNARNPEGVIFNEKRAQRILRRAAGRSAREIVEAIKSGATKFVGGSLTDDATILVVKRTAT